MWQHKASSTQTSGWCISTQASLQGTPDGLSARSPFLHCAADGGSAYSYFYTAPQMLCEHIALSIQHSRVWSCFPFIGSGQNHLARHSERGKKTRQTEEEVGRQHQGMDRPAVRKVPEGSGEQEKVEKTGCKIICGAPTTLVGKELMMMMMINIIEKGFYG